MAFGILRILIHLLYFGFSVYPNFVFYSKINKIFLIIFKVKDIINTVLFKENSKNKVKDVSLSNYYLFAKYKRILLIVTVI